MAGHPPRTPSLSSLQRRNYLKKHLANELEWTLRAATEWHVQYTLELGIDGYHVQVYAMDSTFVHARALFEFFTRKTGRNYYGISEYLVQPLGSPIYTRSWQRPLHRAVMHAQTRLRGRPMASFDGGPKKDLNRMPVDFAKEIVRLWREMITQFEKHSDPSIKRLAPVATDILNVGIKQANVVAISEPVARFKVVPPTWP